MDSKLHAPQNYILPSRTIPFDVGMKIEGETAKNLKSYLDARFTQVPLSKLMEVVSADVLWCYQITGEIKLHLYKFGVGVFTVRDDIFPITNIETYALEYCNARKAAHAGFLETGNRHTTFLRELIQGLRGCAAPHHERVRASASDTWEYEGLSYVMTTSFVFLENGAITYNAMDETEKKNLQIMLDPSIAHAEDSLRIQTDEHGNFEPYSFDLANCDRPQDWIKNPDYSVYISWSAVLAYAREENEKIQTILEDLEVDLQAMWLYVYCLNHDLQYTNEDKNILASQLRTQLYQFNRKYNRFLNVPCSSIPSYVTKIRNELIATSEIQTWVSQYQEYLEFSISETESRNFERQRKYSWLNEILLFIIAFAQTAPLLYQLMTGNHSNIELWPLAIMSIIVIAAIIVIYKKN